MPAPPLILRKSRRSKPGLLFSISPPGTRRGTVLASVSERHCRRRGRHPRAWLHRGADRRSVRQTEDFSPWRRLERQPRAAPTHRLRALIGRRRHEGGDGRVVHQICCRRPAALAAMDPRERVGAPSADAVQHRSCRTRSLASPLRTQGFKRFKLAHPVFNAHAIVVKRQTSPSRAGIGSGSGTQPPFTATSPRSEMPGHPRLAAISPNRRTRHPEPGGDRCAARREQ